MLKIIRKLNSKIQLAGSPYYKSNGSRRRVLCILSYPRKHLRAQITRAFTSLCLVSNSIGTNSQILIMRSSPNTMSHPFAISSLLLPRLMHTLMETVWTVVICVSRKFRTYQSCSEQAFTTQTHTASISLPGIEALEMATDFEV